VRVKWEKREKRDEGGGDGEMGKRVFFNLKQFLQFFNFLKIKI
jgi:hypothetical protein